MKNLQILGAAVALTFVFGLSALAGQMPTDPCAPPAPGETQSPPCAAAPSTPGDSATPGETSAPPSANAVDLLSVAEAAMNLLLTF